MSALPIRQRVALPVVAGLFLLAAIVAPLIGPHPTSFSDLAGALTAPDPDSAAHRVLLASRLPRVAFALVAGAALAVCGLVMQTLLRNPLAEPFTLGISGGATLATLCVVQHSVAGLLASLGVAGALLVPGAAFCGALAALTIVLALAAAARRARSDASTDALILCGVVVNTICGAAIVLIQYLSNPYETAGLLRWIMGGVDVATFTPAMVLLSAMLLCVPMLLMAARPLDILRLGDSSAHHLGVEVGHVRLRLLLLTALLTALVVSYAGPIAFVGLIVPHLARLVAAPRHGALLPVAALGGGAFLALSDLAARTLAAPAEFPVGIITALFGGPFFLLLLLRPVK